MLKSFNVKILYLTLIGNYITQLVVSIFFLSLRHVLIILSKFHLINVNDFKCRRMWPFHLYSVPLLYRKFLSMASVRLISDFKNMYGIPSISSTCCILKVYFYSFRIPSTSKATLKFNLWAYFIITAKEYKEDIRVHLYLSQVMDRKKYIFVILT